MSDHEKKPSEKEEKILLLESDEQDTDAEKELSDLEQYELLKAQSKALKKKMLKAACAILLALVLVFVAVLVLDYINRPTVWIPDDYYQFSPPYHQLDEATKAQYQTDYNNLADESRVIFFYQYGDQEAGGYRVGITEENKTQFDVGVLFLCDWFQTISNGDANGYNHCFSENYWEENEAEDIFKKESFSPQMLYDRSISVVSQKNDQGDKLITYWVEYKILHNDKSFRDDIGSGISRRQDVTVRIREDGSAVIEKLVTYYPVKDTVVIGVIPVLIVIGSALVLTVAVILIKKKIKRKKALQKEAENTEESLQEDLSEDTAEDGEESTNG